MGNRSSVTQSDTGTGCDQTVSSDLQDPVRKKKNDQGYLECEVLGFGPEATESAGAWEACTKNPGHAGFIPAPEFSLAHLPQDYQQSSVLDFIRAASSLTVRLRVNFVSLKRPKGFAFAENRGSPVLHVGSALVTNVSVGQGPCPCKICSVQGSRPSERWFEIRLSTACHVLYNTEEALATKVDFFYDDEKSMREKRLKGMWATEVIKKSKKSDDCFFTCATHDEDFFKQLQDFLEDFRNCKRNLSKELPSESLIVVVSHPHGQPKKVSVGKLTKCETVWAEPRAAALTWILFYSTATCPGSSGAPVFEVSSRTGSTVFGVGTFHSGWRRKGNHSVRKYSSFALH